MVQEVSTKIGPLADGRVGTAFLKNEILIENISSFKEFRLHFKKACGKQ